MLGWKSEIFVRTWKEREQKLSHKSFLIAHDWKIVTYKPSDFWAPWAWTVKSNAHKQGRWVQTKIRTAAAAEVTKRAPLLIKWESTMVITVTVWSRVRKLYRDLPVHPSRPGAVILVLITPTKRRQHRFRVTGNKIIQARMRMRMRIPHSLGTSSTKAASVAIVAQRVPPSQDPSAR